MARPKITIAQNTPARTALAVSRSDATSKLQDRLAKGRDLNQRPISSTGELEILSKDYRIWDDFNRELLKQSFTGDEIVNEYSSWGAFSIPMRPPSLTERISDLRGNIRKKINRLESILERLELYPTTTPEFEEVISPKQLPVHPDTKKVFVVHGHDEAAKSNLEIILAEMGLEPVVLHRQADEGMTIIEKFEKHSDVGYAFVLLTPDEIAYSVSEGSKEDASRRKEFRARPNVIFEFGYFVGKLGRARVCCLYTGDVALPSDVSGLIYKRYERTIEEVAYSIRKDLKAAGYILA